MSTEKKTEGEKKKEGKKRENKVSNWIDNVVSKFTSGDTLPWTDGEMIAACEREAANDGAGLTNSTDRNDSIARLAWALVHSRRSADVQRGIAMLGESLRANEGPLQKREVLYLLAVGYYRVGDHTRSRRLVDEALQIAPDFRQAVALKTMIDGKIAQDGAIGVGIAAAAVGIVASGVAAILLKKK